MPTRSERSSATLDPIFAAIARYLEVNARCDAMHDANDINPRLEADPRLEAAVCDVLAARLALAQTVPTTLAGLAAYAHFLNEQSALVFVEPFFTDGDEYIAFHKSLNQSLAVLAPTVDNRSVARAGAA